MVNSLTSAIVNSFTSINFLYLFNVTEAIILTVCIKGEYKDLTPYYQLEDECTTLLEYNIHKDTVFDSLLEVEPFVYESKAFFYFVAFKQGSLERTLKFCNKGLALKFKKDNLENLISR